VRAGWADRETKAQCGEVGGQPVGEERKKMWAVAGPAGRWTDWAESEGKIPFRIKI
jgi:hypothetical protein